MRVPRTTLLFATLLLLGSVGMASGQDKRDPGRRETVGGAGEPAGQSVRVEPSGEIKQAFDEALGRVIRPMLTEQEARSFARRFGNVAIPFLREQALGHPGQGGRRFAMATLGAIGNASAADALTDVGLKSTPRYSELAIVALAQSDVPDVKRRLEKLATTPGPDGVMHAAALSLRWRGDQHTIQALRMAAAAKTANPRVQRSLERAANAIHFRLHELPSDADQRDWIDYERRFWLAVMEPNPDRNISMGYRQAALAIHREGNLPLSFLERFDGTASESAQAVAIYLLGLQKEAGTIPRLAELAQQHTLVGEAALSALVTIGNEEATGALGELLLIREFRWRSTAVAGLVRIGTEQAARLLDEAAAQQPRSDLKKYYQRMANRIRGAK